MKKLRWIPISILLAASAAAYLTAARTPKQTRAVGPRPDGTSVTPYNWDLTPAGRSVKVRELPFGGALSPDGRWLAISNNGVFDHSISMIDTRAGRAVQHEGVSRPDGLFIGLAFSADGKRLYAAGGNGHNIRVYDVTDRPDRPLQLAARIRTGNGSERTYPGGVALSPDGDFLYAANNASHSVSKIDLAAGHVTATAPVGHAPYAVAISRNGQKLYASDWGDGTVTVLAADSLAARGKIRVGEHPCALALSPSGDRLYVANANSDTVSVIDTATDRVVETISLAPYPGAPRGTMPNALAVSKDGRRLYVANGGNHDIAVVDRIANRWQVAGLIPTGWFPSAVCLSPDEKMLYVVNAKGLGAGPNASPRQYIGIMISGTVSMVAVPGPQQLRRYAAQVSANNGFDAESRRLAAHSPKFPVPHRAGMPSPIKHIFYIIKENRTYDQVLGDMTEGNGDPKYVLFGEKVTPNHHALARQFVLLDNFYVDGTVSADGHQWCTAATVTDYKDKTWPSAYGLRRTGSDDYGPATYPSAGYLWDFAARKKLRYRSYGEMTDVTGLRGHSCPDYKGGLGAKADQKRIDVWLKEFRAFEKNGNLPHLSIMSLPNNHTLATRPGAPTPQAMVADNDYALGRLVEAVSRSRYWKSSAIFVVEDDAQDGPDHVDAHRTVALVISPYTRRGAVDSTLYDNCSMLRTIELILGLPPMSQYDAAATPMFASFTTAPDYRPYKAVPPHISLDEVNASTAYGARASMAMNFDDIDAAPWDSLNRILWHSVKGRHIPMPKPKTHRRSFGLEVE
ncbi:MAG: beta-propeller fold lactonase family protein [Armatimonadetes bacterium]|nr:beta-propeller fold lactonase family protein [Armatimonadota bacterium]